MKLLCKKDFDYCSVKFNEGEIYNSWEHPTWACTHVVENNEGKSYPFDSFIDIVCVYYIWYYFYTISEYREIQLSKINI